MKIGQTTDTITAVITPPGRGGVSAIRISGKNSRKVFSKIWRGRSVCDFESHRLYLGYIVDSDGNDVDEVLAALFENDHSYTGEETIEIFAHGGEVVIKEVLSKIVVAGARVAEPGEFTKRAYLNGKMDIAQAEGVADLISSQSVEGMKYANRQIKGELSQSVERIKEGLIELRSLIEASLDFPDDDLPEIFTKDLQLKISTLRENLERLLNSYREGRLIREGVQVAIIGAPNVGKSSLFNALVGSDRTIVHHRAGTTRDIVKEGISIDGVAFFLHDTAGWRNSTDDVESIGVGRAKELMKNADLILVVFDASREPNAEEKAMLTSLDKEKPHILVINKIDLLPATGYREPATDQSCPVCAKLGDGLDRLKEMMKEKIMPLRQSEGAIITNVRHREAIKKALSQIAKAYNLATKGADNVILAHHLRQAQDFLSEITGEVLDDEVINRIFSQFCIGK